jgi:hypothetical protein
VTAPLSVDESLQQGRAAFNEGRFHRAHELWEDAWNQLAAGPTRLRVQGLIQIAAGLHHLQGGRPRPAAAVLARGLAKLTNLTAPRSPDAEDDPLVVAGIGLTPPALIGPFCREIARLLALLEDPGAATPDPTTLRL